MIDYYEPNIDLTLLGCGFLGISIDKVLEAAIGILRELRGFLKAPGWPLISIKALVEQSLDKAMPKDAHSRCSRKLGLSITLVSWPMRNKFISRFESRKELLDALAAGCFIPIWSGGLQWPLYKGQACIDGAYTDNKPKFPLTEDEKLAGLRQVEVCPFASECQVSPEHERFGLGSCRIMGTRYQMSWGNFVRMNQAMLPYAVVKYRSYLQSGHDDMKKYVLNNRLIKCRQCYHGERKEEQEDGCLECLRLLEKVDSLRVPDELVQLIH